MCGFVGFTDPAGDRDRALDVAARMLVEVAHRGPDGTSALHEDGLTLAHCALRFVDLHHADQPFRSVSGRTLLVFNGEVYNHAELRRELGLGLGGDTEVLAELYERFGIQETLRRVHGMYAIALYDTARRTLLLVRDRFGKKPLYYSRTPTGTVFASELAPLLRHPGCSGRPDPAALADFLVLRAFPAPRTAVSGVAKVRAGTYVEIGPDGARETEYWTPGPPEERGRMPVRAAVAEFEGLLRSAIDRRVTSTPSRFGVLLSGGLDSSVVAALAQQGASTPVPAFTVGFEDRSFDESEPASLVARHIGLDHHLLTCTERDLAEVVTEDVVRIDEPLADPSLLPTLLVCRAARAEVRTVLTGDGADEILLGYRFFQAEKALQLVGAVPAPVLAALAWLAKPGIGARAGNLPLRAALRQLARGADSPPERRYYAASAPFRPTELAGVLSGPARAALAESSPFAEVDRLLARHGDLSALERSQLGIITHFLRDVILTKVDRASMRHALEVRSPYLDRDVVDYCAGLPTDLKLHRFTSKYLLRLLAARHLPAEITRRRKLGFRAPIAALLRGPLRPVLLDVLTPDRLGRHGLLDPVAARGLVDDHLASRVDNSAKVWALLCFQLWHDSVLSPVHLAPPAPVRSVR